MTHDCTMVIPCYNEALRLDAAAFVRFVESNPTCRLLFVNDGSTDNTIDLLHDLCRHGHQRIDILDLPCNGGKAEAVRRGVLSALDGGAAYVGFLDADLATPLSVIPQFCDILNRRVPCQLVIGCRLPLLGHSIERRYYRQVLGKAFCWAASRVLGLTIHDTQCGAKLFRASAECRRAFATPFASRWIFDVELIARLLRLWREAKQLEPRQAIFEYVLEEWREVRGSKLRSTDFLRAFFEIAGIAWSAGAVPELFPMSPEVKPRPDESKAA